MRFVYFLRVIPADPQGKRQPEPKIEWASCKGGFILRTTNNVYEAGFKKSQFSLAEMSWMAKLDAAVFRLMLRT